MTHDNFQLYIQDRVFTAGSILKDSVRDRVYWVKFENRTESQILSGIKQLGFVKNSGFLDHVTWNSPELRLNLFWLCWPVWWASQQLICHVRAASRCPILLEIFLLEKNLFKVELVNPILRIYWQFKNLPLFFKYM